MTTPYRGAPYPVPYPPRPPQPPPRRNYAKVIALVAVALLAVMALVVVVIVLRSSGNSTTTTATSAPATTSTSEQWYAAVCQPGTLRFGVGGTMFPHADSDGYCLSNASSMSRPIWIAVYSRVDVGWMKEDPGAKYHPFAWATIVADNGDTVLIVAPNDSTGASLEPLAQFGFTITPSQG